MCVQHEHTARDIASLSGHHLVCVCVSKAMTHYTQQFGGASLAAPSLSLSETLGAPNGGKWSRLTLRHPIHSSGGRYGLVCGESRQVPHTRGDSHIGRRVRGKWREELVGSTQTRTHTRTHTLTGWLGNNERGRGGVYTHPYTHTHASTPDVRWMCVGDAYESMSIGATEDRAKAAQLVHKLHHNTHTDAEINKDANMQCESATSGNFFSSMCICDESECVSRYLNAASDYVLPPPSRVDRHLPSPETRHPPQSRGKVWDLRAVTHLIMCAFMWLVQTLRVRLGKRESHLERESEDCEDDSEDTSSVAAKDSPWWWKCTPFDGIAHLSSLYPTDEDITSGLTTRCALFRVSDRRMLSRAIIESDYDLERLVDEILQNDSSRRIHTHTHILELSDAEYDCVSVFMLLFACVCVCVYLYLMVAVRYLK